MAASSEKQRVLINAVSNGLGFAATVVVVFFVSPILVHGLGDERYGIWQLVNSVLAYMTIADLGIGAAVLRFVARFDGLKEEENVNRIFSCSMVAFACIGMVLLVITLVLALGWGCPLGVRPEIARDTRWLLALLGANLAFGLPLGLYRSLLQGLGRYPTINAVKVSGMLVRSTLCVAVVLTGGGILGIGIAVTICDLGANLTYAFLAHRSVPSLKFSLEYVDWETIRTIRGYSAGVFTSLTAGRIAMASEVVVVGVFLGPAYVTYYSIAARLPRFGGDGIRTMLSVLTPSFSRLHAQGKVDQTRDLFIDVSRNVLFLACPVTLGVFLFGRSFLGLWMGAKYAEAGFATLLVLIAPLPLGLLMTLALRLLHGLGRVRVVAVCAVARTCATIGLSILLVNWFGILGVALAVSVTLVINAIVIVTYSCRVVQVSLPRFLMNSMAKPALPAAILLLIWIPIRIGWTVESWPGLIIPMLAGLIPYCITACLVDEQMRRLVTRCLAVVTPSSMANRVGEPSEGPYVCLESAKSNEE